MITTRMSGFAAVALLGGVLAGTPASAQELVFGSWTSPKEYQNVQVMPKIFKEIEAETKGAIKWKLIPGGAIADGKTTFSAVKDGLMQGGLGIVTYSPSTIPSVFVIYSTVVIGHNDVVAASAAVGFDGSSDVISVNGVTNTRIRSSAPWCHVWTTASVPAITSSNETVRCSRVPLSQ